MTNEYEKAIKDPDFQAELNELLKRFVGRPSPLYHAKRMSKAVGGAQIWLKREDLNHTGAHKINNTLGQGLLTLRMGKTRVIAETGQGNMAWPRLPRVLTLDCLASSTWEQKMSDAKSRTSLACD